MSHAPASRPPAALRSLGLTVYAPSFLFSIGQGAVIPIVALAALEVGAAPATAAMIVAARGIGSMVCSVPAGVLVGRLGERRAMTLGTAVLILALVGAVASAGPVAFGAWMFLMGCGWSVWLLARLTYVTEAVPIERRGRALSVLGGVNRIGNFAGPFLAAAVIALAGLDGAFYVHLAFALAGWIILLLAPEPFAARSAADQGPASFRAILAEHAPVFATAGAAAFAIGLLRSARHAVIPLWAAAIGLDAARAALIFGIASALDMALFYPAGSLSDRFGRKAVAIPCMAVMAAGFILLPATSTFLALALVGLLMGFGNGLGSGIVMTLGADLAPARGRAEFLGVWRLLGDVGTAGGPVVAAGVTALASLAAAAVALGGIGLAGAGVVLLAMPETLRPAGRRPTGSRD